MRQLQHASTGRERPGAANAPGQMHVCSFLSPGFTPEWMAPSRLAALSAIGLKHVPLVQARTRIGALAIDTQVRDSLVRAPDSCLANVSREHNPQVKCKTHLSKGRGCNTSDHICSWLLREKELSNSEDASLGLNGNGPIMQSRCTAYPEFSDALNHKAHLSLYRMVQ